jgi:RNA-directed DNA polymerase
VWHPANLLAAWQRVYANRGGSGIDGQTVHQYHEQRQRELECLHDLLKHGQYVPQPVKRVWIPKPGSQEKRPLGIPAVRDRVVQTALRQTLEPIFEHVFSEHSYGFRPNRGCKDALRRVDALLKSGHGWVVDADLKSYFDTIPHDQLMARVEEHVADGRVRSLLRNYLDQKVMDGLAEWTPDAGTPQGAVISPLLANLYLNPLDHLMADKGFEMVRYADDFVILCRTREEAENALTLVTAWVTAAGLTLHPVKTRIVHEAEDGFDFLGYTFKRGQHWPRQKSKAKFKDSIRANTKRNNGKSLRETIALLNPKLRGWYGYFKHCNKRTFKELDGWIRRRLRAILNKREGRSRWKFTQQDHQRWTNNFFHAQGLFSLATAHVAECQSRQREPINWRAGCGKSASPVRREG